MDEETLNVVLETHRLFKTNGLTLSVAESCTGGLLSHYITEIPGSSEFFRVGIIVYSVESKIKILGISPSAIKDHGVVSEQTAREMAERIRVLTDTDYSVSTTGKLGPDSPGDKDTGLVYIAVSRKGTTVSRGIRFKGDRKGNKRGAALSALKLLVEVQGIPR